MSTETVKSHGSTRPKNGTMRAKKAQRRAEAEVRQAEYSKLTLEQKLAKAGKKQMAKLLAKASK